MPPRVRDAHAHLEAFHFLQHPATCHHFTSEQSLVTGQQASPNAHCTAITHIVTHASPSRKSITTRTAGRSTPCSAHRSGASHSRGRYTRARLAAAMAPTVKSRDLDRRVGNGPVACNETMTSTATQSTPATPLGASCTTCNCRKDRDVPPVRPGRGPGRGAQ